MKFKLFFILTVLFSGTFAQEVLAQTSEKIPSTTTQKPIVPVAKQQVQANKTTAKVKWVPKPKAGYQAPARQVDTVKNTDFTLAGQYKFMLSRSKNINGYKLVNPYRLDAVWASVLDTLKKERAELATIKTKIAEQDKTITSLRTEVTGKEETLTETSQNADEINVLGISFEKGTYSIIVWSIILILVISLIVVVARSAKNIIEAKHRMQLYEEITAEFQTYKAKTSEKERKLARELQDERNKLDELNGNR